MPNFITNNSKNILQKHNFHIKIYIRLIFELKCNFFLPFRLCLVKNLKIIKTTSCFCFCSVTFATCLQPIQTYKVSEIFHWDNWVILKCFKNTIFLKRYDYVTFETTYGTRIVYNQWKFMWFFIAIKGSKFVMDS